MFTTDVVLGGGGGAGFLPEGGNWIGTIIPVTVGVTGDVTIGLMLPLIAPVEDGSIMLSGL